MSDRVPWIFTDTPNIPLAANPHTDNGSLAVEKDIVYENTAGPGGKTLIFERGTSQKTLSFKGKIYTEAQYNVFAAELEKDVSQLTDDRGVIYDVVWEKFVLTRDATFKHPWKHEYDLTGYVLDYTIPA